MKERANQTMTQDHRTKDISLDDILANDSISLIDDGYEFIEKGNFDQALQLFIFGAQKNAQDPDILNGLGITLCEMGKLDEAEKILERALKLNPNDAIIYSNLAGIYWDKNKYEKAIYCYHTALKIEPDLEEIYFNLVYLYIESGYLYMAYITCMTLKDKFPGNDEVQELMREIILNLGISMY